MLTGLLSVAYARTDAPSEPLPNQEVVWPDDRDDAPTDAVIYVKERGPGLPEPSLARDDGSVVAFTSHVIDGVGLTWRVLVPDAPLVEGGYSVALDGSTATFTVGSEVAEVADAPGPYRRWMGTECEDGNGLSYRTCDGGILHLAAVAEVEPPSPTLDEPGDVRVVGVGEETLELSVAFGVSGGWTGTVWIGDFDEAGRFTGWWDGDLVEMPDPGVRTTEAPSGTSGGASYTVTSVAGCPTFSGWEILSEDDCAPAEVVTTTTAPCGCRTSGSLGGAWVLGLVLFGRRRVRPGR